MTFEIEAEVLHEQDSILVLYYDTWFDKKLSYDLIVFC